MEKENVFDPKHLNEELAAAIVEDTNQLLVKEDAIVDQLWKPPFIDLSIEIPEREPLITQESSGSVLLYRRGIHVVKGKQKAGKTFYNAILMTALTNPDGYCDLTPSSNVNKVLFVDTEQDYGDVVKVAQRVHELNDWDLKKNQASFGIISLRGYGIDERKIEIENHIRVFKPDVVVIDGIVDLCRDFNSPQESHEIVTQLMQWTEEYDVAIITTLHTNKGDQNMRGHLGTILSQKADNVIEISKIDCLHPCVDCKVSESRHKPIDNFSFRIVESSITGNALPELYVQIAQSQQSNKHQDMFKAVLTKPMKYTELANAVMKYTDRKEASASRYIKTAVTDEIIKNNEGLYEIS